MASAGTVTVDFAAETAKFTAEVKKVNSELAAIKKQGDAASAAFSNFTRGLRNVVGLATVGVFLRAVARESKESEAAVTQLNSALGNIGANVEVASRDLRGYADTLQRQTGVSDEAILGIQTLLLGFRGLTSGVIKRATADILDLSARLGIDGATAAKALGKALEDPVAGVTALGRLGVRFSESQKDVIKSMVETGDRAGALNMILTEVENRFGGAAAAARDTFGGAVGALQNQLGELLEGKDGSLAGAAAAINQLTTTLQDPDLKEGIDAFVSGIAKAVEVSAKAAAGIAGLARTLGERFAKNVLFPDDQLSAAQALRKELERETQLLAAREKNSGGFSKEELANQRAYVATLAQRVNLLDQLAVKEVLLQEGGKGAPPKPDPAAEFKTPDVVEGPLLDEEALNKIRLQSLEAFNLLKIEMDDEFSQKIKTNFEKRINDENTLYAGALAYRRELDQRYHDDLKALRQDNIGNAIGLLQQLGAKSKAFAIAAVVIEKTLTVQRILQANAVAAELAFASQLIPGIPATLATAYAAKAAVLAQGRISAALAIASGALQIGQIAGGNGQGKGSQFDPVITQNQNGAQGEAGATSKNVVQVVFNGNVYGQPDFQQAVVNAVREATGDRDVVIITPGSRQALELRG